MAPGGLCTTTTVGAGARGGARGLEHDHGGERPAGGCRRHRFGTAGRRCGSGGWHQVWRAALGTGGGREWCDAEALGAGYGGGWSRPAGVRPERIRENETRRGRTEQASSAAALSVLRWLRPEQRPGCPSRSRKAAAADFRGRRVARAGFTAGFGAGFNAGVPPPPDGDRGAPVSSEQGNSEGQHGLSSTCRSEHMPGRRSRRATSDGEPGQARPAATDEPASRAVRRRRAVAIENGNVPSRHPPRRRVQGEVRSRNAASGAGR